MITYSTNWMGPVSLDWYRERGLLEEGTEPRTYYSAGRIDIRNSTKSGYDGWDEYSLPPMHGEDWNNFSVWLDDFTTEELWSLEELIFKYEEDSNTTIRWADDEWHRCHECGMINTHKMDCFENYSYAVSVDSEPNLIPDSWAILEVNHDSESFQKILSEWIGSYTQADTWRLSSRIKTIDKNTNEFYAVVHTESGSSYNLFYSNQGLSFNTEDMFNKLKSKHVDSINIVKLKNQDPLIPDGL